MNCINLFNIRVAGKDNDAVKVKQCKTGLMAYFNAGEKINADKWQDYLMVAYGETAQRISSMKIVAGSRLNVVGELSLEPGQNGNIFAKVTIMKCDFSSFASPASSATKPTAPLQEENKEINLDEEDLFAQNDLNDEIFN